MSADAWSARIEEMEASMAPRRLQEHENALRIAQRAHLTHLALPCLSAGVLTGAFLGIRGKPVRAILLGALRGTTAVAAAQFTWMALDSSPSSRSPSPYAAPASAVVLSLVSLVPSPLSLLVSATCASAIVGAGGAAMWRVGKRLTHVRDSAQSEPHSSNRH